MSIYSVFIFFITFQFTGYHNFLTRSFVIAITNNAGIESFDRKSFDGGSLKMCQLDSAKPWTSQFFSLYVPCEGRTQETFLSQEIGLK